jgi:hypothetical protein
MTGPFPAGRDTHMCDSKELLVSFLYNEIDPASRRAFQNHLTTCAECRGELAELEDTRARIASWTPPDADLGFRVVREAETPKRRWFHFSPAWSFAAAAVLLLALGAAVANLDVRYSKDGLIVRTGWNHATENTGTASRVTPVEWKTQASELDQRLRQIERAIAARPQASPIQNASAEMSDAELLQRVREIVGQSETRQQRAFASRLADLTQEFDAQRQLDMVAIDQGMTRWQNTSGAEVKQIREVMNRYVSQAAYQQK